MRAEITHNINRNNGLTFGNNSKPASKVELKRQTFSQTFKNQIQTPIQQHPTTAVISGVTVLGTATALIGLKKQAGKFEKELLKSRLGDNVIANIPNKLSNLKNNVKEVTIETSDKLKLKCWEVKPKKDKPYVIYCHGTGSNLLENAPALDKLAQEGYGILGLEYRGYAGNKGEVNEKGLRKDAQAAFDYLKNNGAKKIGVHGHSLGGAVAVDLASRNKMDFLIVNSSLSSTNKLGKLLIKKGFDDIEASKILKKVVEFIPTNMLPTSNKFNSFKKLKNIDKNCKVLFVHSKGDKHIPHEMSEEMFEEAKKHLNHVDIHLTPDSNGNNHRTFEDKAAPIKDFLDKV